MEQSSYWITKLGHNWVSEDDAAKAINAVNSLYHINLTKSQTGSATGSVAGLLESIISAFSVKKRHLLHR